MIVKDEESIDEALQILETSPEGVRYDDRYSYLVVASPMRLARLCSEALGRGEIAIVVPRSREHEREEYDASLIKVRKERIEEERRRFKEWLKAHPEVAKASAAEVPGIMKRMHKESAK